MCLFELLFSFFLNIYPRVGLVDHMVVLFFFFLRNLRRVFHSGCTNLQSYQQCKGFLFLYTHSSIYYDFVDFLKMANQTGMWWNVIVVLICTSLIMRDMEHLFMFLLATICMSSLENCLFRSSAHFLIGLFFGYWVVCAVWTFWQKSLCKSHHLQNVYPIL